MIDGVVLAAGRSLRFGSPKMLVPFRGRPLLWHALDACALSRLSQIHAVISQHGDDVGQAIASWSGVAEELHTGNSRPIHVVRAPRSDSMIVSLQTGLRAVRGDGAMVILADMPLITPSIIDRLIDAFEAQRGFVIPLCGGIERHPRIIPRELFDEFLDLGEDARGVEVIDRHRERVQLVPVGEIVDFTDVDTIGDLPRS